MKRRALIVAALFAACLLGVVATVTVRGGATTPNAPPPQVTTATVQRTTLRTTVYETGTLGYAGGFTVTTADGTTADQLATAEAASASAAAKVTADEQSLAQAQGLALHNGDVLAAEQQLSSDRSALAAARGQLAADRSLGCPAVTPSNVTSAPAANQPGGPSANSGSAGSGRSSSLDLAPLRPQVETGAASAIGSTSAALGGTVDPNGANTQYAFRYGSSTSMASETAPAGAGAGAAAVEVTATLRGLRPDTTYLFEIVASSSAGTSTGRTESFTTAASSCVTERATVTSDAQLVALADDALSTASINASSSVAAAQQQLASDRLAASAASRTLARQRESSSNTGAVVTSVPRVNSVITRGRAVYSLDGTPIPLFFGTIVLSRALYPGVSDGPDVAELATNLSALGFPTGPRPARHFSSSVESALRAFQASRGIPSTGILSLGDVVLAPGSLRVSNVDVTLGETLQPNAPVLEATSVSRIVTVPLDPANSPNVAVGEPVSILLPSQATTPGRITAIAAAPPNTTSSSGNGSGGQGGATTSAVTDIVVTPSSPDATGSSVGVPVQVSLTTQSATNVLAVPISALLALAGGGYGVQVVTPTGVSRLVGVTTGLFSGTEVEISGSGIGVGTKVVVAQ